MDWKIFLSDSNNFVPYLIWVLVAIFVIGLFIHKYLKDKNKHEDQEWRKAEDMKRPQPEPVDFGNDLFINTKFNDDIGLTETSHIIQLKNQRDYIKDELQSKIKQYKDLKGEFAKMLGMEKKMRNTLTMLREHYKLVEEQIMRLEK